MLNRVAAVEATKAYAEAFNKQDLAAIADLLDNENVIFSRQEQNAIIGKENVLRRIRSMFARLKDQRKTIQVIGAIVDLGKTKARPCLISLLNNVPVALCVISCKVNGKINAITILLGGEIVGSARPTEPLPGQKEADTSEQNRADVIAVTKVYIDAFNQHDLKRLGELLDEHESVFNRSDQKTVLGRERIIARVKDLYDRLNEHGQDLKVVNAIIDHDGYAAWPCTLGILDGTPVSVGMLNIRENCQIAKIDIILTPTVVAKARPTEPLEEVKKKPLDMAQVIKREEWLQSRAIKIKQAIARHGNLPQLINKQMRVEQQLEKIEYLKQKLR